ncbi:MAG: InlB B-repeat-containing protein, partial [Nitrospirae bacterium]|nr:InlB B-repeat-containing protein [Nitrospirota bacterium]
MYRKRFRWHAAIVLAAFFFAVSCGGGGGSGGGSGSGISSGTTSVTINLGRRNSVSGYSTLAADPNDVNHVRCVVSAPDMETLDTTVDVAGSASIQLHLNVPNGNNRKFEIFAYDSENGLLYYGTSTANLNGTAVTLAISMRDVTLPALTIIKQVINDDGGTAAPGDFDLYVIDELPDLYISSKGGTGAPAAAGGDSMILRFNGGTGAFIDIFAEGLGRSVSISGYPVFDAGQNLYVSRADTLNPTLVINKYERMTGGLLDEFPTFAGSGGSAGLTIGPDGNLYLSMQAVSQVRKFDPATGADLGAFAASGSGGMSRPVDLAFGPDNNLYLVDDSIAGVLKFNGATGAYMGMLGSGGLFNSPRGITFGADGHIYVTATDSAGGYGVYEYSGTAAPAPSLFTNDALLSHPEDLAFGTGGDLFVANGNDDVLRFDGTTGALVSHFITPGRGGLNSPDGLTFSPAEIPMLNGVPKTLQPKRYRAGEASDPAYSASFGGDCDADGYVTLSLGQSKTCVITNDDIYFGFDLDVTRTGTGSGTVTSSPAGINCGAACSADYNPGTVVTLTATPAAGSTFAGWSGNADCTDGIVTMDASKNCTATFNTEMLQLSLTSIGTGSGAVISSPAGINCGGDCTESYAYNTSVTLTAAPATGSTFAGWSGDADCSDGIVTMDAARNCTATFTLSTYALTVNKNGTGSGTVTSSPAGINCGAACSAIYNYNTIVTLSATPSTGSVFAGWSGTGGCVGTGTCTVTMTSAKSVTATFDTEMLQLSLTSAGAGTGTVTSNPAGINCGADCAETYAYNTTVTLTATPAPGSAFTGWSGNADCADGFVTMDAAKACIANFGIAACVSPPSGMVSWWPGNGNANDAFDGNHGTLMNGAAFAAGMAGQAFEFNGSSSYVSLADASSLHFGAGDLSILAWIKTPTSTSETFIFFKELAAYPYPRIILAVAPDGKIHFDVSDCGTGACGWGSSGKLPLYTANRIDDDQWHHVTAVRNATGYQLFVDGQLSSALSQSPLVGDSTGMAYIGGYTTGYHYTGRIDEVQIFDSALNATEIAAIYQAGNVGICPVPNLSVSPYLKNFGSINLGSTSAVQTFTFTNTGSADLHVSVPSGQLFGPDAAMFTVALGAVNPCPLPPFTSAPGSSCNLDVTFSPTSSGAKNALLRVTSDDPDTAALDVPVSGIGVSTLNTFVNPENSGMVTGAGINCPGDCAETYDTLSPSVTLTATAATGYHFVNWSGDASGSSNPITVSMNTSKNVTANFAIDVYALDIIKIGIGGGAVTSSPGGINCGANCVANFDFGTDVTLTATPDIGSTFAGWSGGGCSGAGTCVVRMDSAKSVTAAYDTEMVSLSLTSTGTGGGMVISSPEGIHCGSIASDCTESYAYNTTVTLTGLPDTGSVFTGWSGTGGCVGTGTCTVTMDGAKSVTATFDTEMLQLSLTSTGNGSGTVTSNPAGINCGSDCTESYAYNTTVTLNATPSSNSTFAGWSGDADCPDGIVTIDVSKGCTATFILKPVLTVIVTGSGEGGVSSSPGSINCSGSGGVCDDYFNLYDNVTLTAAPDEGSVFAGWSGDCDVNGQVTMDGDKTCTAEFTSGAVGSERHNASGTYNYNSATGLLQWNWTSSDFTCEGPEVGQGSDTVTTLNSTTLTWEGGGDTTTWTRPSGPDGSILGIWTLSEISTGNLFEITFNNNGTVTLIGFIARCGGGAGSENPKAAPQHWADGYYVQLRYVDPEQTASSVSVTGPGITGSAALTYNTEWNSWGSGTPESEIFLGTSYPAELPFTYTFTITDETGTWTADSTVSCFEENFATGLSPAGTVTGTPTFSWTGISDPGVRYGVELHSYGSTIWSRYDISGTSIVYDGPPLLPGTTYDYDVPLKRGACGESYAQGSFTFAYEGVWGGSRLKHGSWGSESNKIVLRDDGSGTTYYRRNDDGSWSQGSEDFTYVISYNGDGSFTITMTPEGGGAAESSRFFISDNGNVMLIDNVNRIDSENPEEVFEALVKLDPDKIYGDADLQGDYYGIGYENNSDSAAPPAGNGNNMAISTITSFGGDGDYTYYGTANSDGAVWFDDGGSDPKTYSADVDGHVLIQGIVDGYLSGDGRVFSVSGPRITDQWMDYFLMKKGDRAYATSDLEGTWVVAGFGDYNGENFLEQIGKISCDSAGNCEIGFKINRSDGSTSVYFDTASVTVAGDGSFGTSLQATAPAYSGAIGNDGNTIIMNTSFNPSNPNDREIAVGIRCSSCTEVVGLGKVTVSGRVLDGEREDPISGAVIGTNLDGQTATTNANGYFFLQTDTVANYSSTPYTVNIDAFGYNSFSLNQVWGDHPTDQTFYLNPLSFNLTVSKDGTGTGSVMSFPGGIDCGSDCSAAYIYNSTVTLTANAGANSVFTGWSGTGGCFGTGTCVLTMDGAKSVTATFDLKPVLTVIVTGSGEGEVVSDPGSINCSSSGGTCDDYFNPGENVTLSQSPSIGSTFTGWGGDCDENGQVTMDGDKTCTAVFNIEILELSLTSAGSGSGTVTSDPVGINCGSDCVESYTENTVVTLNAAPSPSSAFAGWSGNADCSDGTVTMDAAKSCTATFDALRITRVSVASSGAQGNINSIRPSISGDGRYVAFQSDATNLVAGDTNESGD